MSLVSIYLILTYPNIAAIFTNKVIKERYDNHKRQKTEKTVDIKTKMI